MSMRVVTTALACAAVLNVTACVRISTTTLAARSKAVCADSVQVFAVDRPQRFTEVAVLKSHRFLVADSHVLTALREQAGALGANGLLLINAASSGAQHRSGVGVIVGPSSPGNVVVGNAETEVDAFERAIAIRFKPDSSTSVQR